jgi:hypothetical protein
MFFIAGSGKRGDHKGGGALGGLCVHLGVLCGFSFFPSVYSVRSVVNVFITVLKIF